MKVIVIASGSKGNCTYIELQKRKILIDLGISRKRITECLAQNNIDCSSITDVFITHEHSDHVGSLASFFAKSNANLYMSIGTAKGILTSSNAKNKAIIDRKILDSTIHFLEKNEADSYLSIALDDGVIQPISAFHDAIETVGYVVVEDNKKLVYLTDTGYVHEKLFPIICNAECYILECNHDPEVLMNTDRPYELKMRILSTHGHLSNEDALHALAINVSNKTKYVFYAHISEECNIPELIDLTRQKVFKDMGISDKEIEFFFTSQESCRCIEL